MTGGQLPYSTPDSCPWSPFPPRRARPGPGPHRIVQEPVLTGWFTLKASQGNCNTALLPWPPVLPSQSTRASVLCTIKCPGACALHDQMLWRVCSARSDESAGYRQDPGSTGQDVGATSLHRADVSWPARPGRARLGMTLEPLLYLLECMIGSRCWEGAHKGPYVGVSRPRSWSHLPVLGAISWAFIAKS